MSSAPARSDAQHHAWRKNVSNRASAAAPFLGSPQDGASAAEDGQCSSLRQPRLAQPVNMMLDILGVLVDGKTFPAFNCEPRVDPQHLRGFGSRLLKLFRLGIGGRQKKMRPLQIG